MRLWFFFFVSSVQPSPHWKWINLLPNMCVGVYISICSPIYPSICSAVCSEQRFHQRNGWKNKKKRDRGAGCSGPSRALSLWHKSLVWSREHNNARPHCTLGPGSKIIPIMQHVCDCRNPPWPSWCQRRDARQKPKPPYRCQILGTHTHCSYSVIQLVVTDAVGRMCATDVSRAPRSSIMYSTHWPSSPLSHRPEVSAALCHTNMVAHGGLDETTTALTQVVRPTCLPK